jgi:hypothetical protein
MVHVTMPLLETFLKFNIGLHLSFLTPSPSIAGLLPTFPLSLSRNMSLSTRPERRLLSGSNLIGHVAAAEWFSPTPQRCATMRETHG